MRVKYQEFFVSELAQKLSNELLADLKKTAYLCLEEIPDYQIFNPSKLKDSDKIVLVVAYEKDRVIGFSSSVEVQTKYAKVLHLGLTCVHPRFRGNGLTHVMFQKLIKNYLLRRFLRPRLWLSNCACVFSSLGNVGEYFEEVYPSPKYPRCPSLLHYYLGQAMSDRRSLMFVGDEIKFDQHRHVYEKSVAGSIFAKDSADRQFYHRDQKKNEFYQSWMDIDQGDELLQIGWFNLKSVLIQMLKIAIGYRYLQRKKLFTSVQIEQ